MSQGCAQRVRGEAFDVVSGDIYLWERMWQDTAKYLGMETASPVPLTLARHMHEKGEQWREIAERHNLIQPDLGKLVGWGDSIFHTETVIISDTNKIYRFGFTERADSKASLFRALDSLNKQRVRNTKMYGQR